MRTPILYLMISLAVPVFAMAQEKKADAPPPSDQEKAMMAAMEKLAAKGEPHRKLALLAGEFTVSAKCFMPGSDQPQVSQGTNKNELILDGRWLRSDFAGSMMGQSFTGLGLLGYDNSLQKYVGTWVDSMTTQIMQMQGTADASGNVITLTGESYCPAVGQRAQFRYVYTLGGNDSYKFEIYGPGPDGKEQKGMEITYTRAK